MLVPEAERPPRDQRLESTRVVVEGRRLVLRVVLVLSLVDEERDRLARHGAQHLFEGVDECRLAAGDHREPIVVNEEARFRQQVPVAMLVALSRQDVGARGFDDLPPYVLAKRAQGAKLRSHDQLQLLLWAFKKARRHHRTVHDARMAGKCKRGRRILA